MSTNPTKRRIARLGIVVSAAGLAVVFGGGGIASAHVTARVIGEPATQGGYTKITFRVPNEDQAAGTVKLEVKMPTETPVASLRTKPIPGWTAQVVVAKLATPVKTHDTEITEAVSTITWTAGPGVRINPGEFQEFEVSGGPMPETDKLVLPAVQTYDNGKAVSWDAPPPASGAEEPEHPAPVVALAPADAADQQAGAPANGDTHTGDSQTPAEGTAAPASSTDTTARWLGGIGLVVGALGLGFGAGATMRARRATAAPKAKDES
jgi:periplasmic copper chaperone A